MTTDDDSEIARLYPSYALGKGDIAEKEYELAARATENESRIYSNTSAIIAAAASLLSSIILGKIDTNFFSDLSTINFTVATSILGITFYFALAHLSNLRRNYVYAVRKLIVLRRMQGQSYGASHLVLPNWRLEGADIPYAIHMFPGWRVRHFYPFYALILFTGSVFASLLNKAIEEGLFQSSEKILSERTLVIALTATWLITGTLSARRLLFDDHENFRLLFARLVSAIFKIKLTQKFEYTLYRARLARAELYRLKIDLRNLSTLAIFREDRAFLSHSGFSVKGIFRAAYRKIRYGEQSGASTITQQLARTLFIVKPQATLRRKIVEILLAIWLTSKIEKHELLEIYLASVRFERGIDGITAAMNYFFGKIINQPTKAQSFVLIERLANIHSLYRKEAVAASLNNAISHKIISKTESDEVLLIYKKLVAAHILAEMSKK